MFHVFLAPRGAPEELFGAIWPRLPNPPFLAGPHVFLGPRGAPETLFRTMWPRFPGHQVLAGTHVFLAPKGAPETRFGTILLGNLHGVLHFASRRLHFSSFFYEEINPPTHQKRVNYDKINPPTHLKAPPGGGPKGPVRQREP